MPYSRRTTFPAVRQILQSTRWNMRESHRGAAVPQIVWTVAGLLVIVQAGVYIAGKVRGRVVKFSTPYQAVLLSNGSVYFGNLDGYGGPHPVLTEVYYIVSQTNPETKQVSNTLVKRGKEPHQPDRMYLNANQIVFVEPVGTSSKVADLIQKSKTSQ